MFGDMGNTLIRAVPSLWERSDRRLGTAHRLRFLPYIQFADLMLGQHHLHHAICFAGPQSHPLTTERLADLVAAALETELAAAVHLPDRIAAGILRRSRVGLVASLAGTPASHRRFHVQCFVRTDVIVDPTPVIK